jgi:hypothetical protein
MLHVVHHTLLLICCNAYCSFHARPHAEYSCVGCVACSVLHVATCTLHPVATCKLHVATFAFIQLLRRIIAKADVLIQNLAPGAGTTHSRTQTETQTRTHTHAARCMPLPSSVSGQPTHPPTHPPGPPTQPTPPCRVQRRVRAFAPRRCTASTRGSSRWTSQGDHPPNAQSARRRMRYGATPKACVGRAVCASQTESLCFRPAARGTRSTHNSFASVRRKWRRSGAPRIERTDESNRQWPLTHCSCDGGRCTGDAWRGTQPLA